jgi:hypothetical protein
MTLATKILVRVLNWGIVASTSFLFFLGGLWVMDKIVTPLSGPIDRVGQHVQEAIKKNEPITMAKTWWTAVDKIRCPEDEIASAALRSRILEYCGRALPRIDPNFYLIFRQALADCDRLLASPVLHLGDKAAASNDDFKERLASRTQCIAQLRPPSDSPPERRAAFSAAARELHIATEENDLDSDCQRLFNEEREQQVKRAHKEQEPEPSFLDKLISAGILAQACPARGVLDLFWMQRMRVGYFVVVYKLKNSDTKLDRWILLSIFVLSGIWAGLLLLRIGPALPEGLQSSSAIRLIIWPFLSLAMAVVAAYVILGALFVTSWALGGMVEESHRQVATACSCCSGFFSALRDESFLTRVHNLSHSMVHRLLHRT